jgi:hypothetical protein
MDILAHALWTNAGARKANQMFEKNDKPKINWAWATFWGIFPDLFAFSIPFFVRFYSLIFGSISLSHFFQRPPVAEENVLSNGFSLAPHLYPYSHSIVIFSVAFIIVWIIYRRPRWELLGWALHIVIDIFSHSVDFYPTPFLFPISSYHFTHGIAWSNKWYMIINYTALLAVYGRSFLKKKPVIKPLS